MPTIAKTLSEINAEWVDGILRDADILKDTSVRVTEIDADLIGNGNMGQVVRVGITYSGHANENAPNSLCVKFAAEKLDRRRYAIDRGIYANEVRFYQNVASTISMRTPRCYFAGIDRDEGWFNLVLEDLSSTTKPGDSIGGGTLAQARVGIEELVKLHVPRWNDPQLPVVMEQHCEKKLTTEQFAGYLNAADQPLQELGGALSTEQIQLIREIMPKSLDWLASWTTPFTLQHSDYRLDNMLFGTTENAPPLVVIDWQIVRVGPPLIDVAYFLGDCLSTKERRLEEKFLLQTYHDGLVSMGVTGYSFDAMWLDYRRYCLFGLFTAVGTYRRIQHTDYSRRLFLNSIQKYSELALDLNAADTLVA